MNDTVTLSGFCIEKVLQEYYHSGKSIIRTAIDIEVIIEEEDEWR